MTKKTSTHRDTRTLSTPSLYDRLTRILDKEFDSLQDTLQLVSPEKRLDFIAKTLPLLLRYKETEQGETWGIPWEP